MPIEGDAILMAKVVLVIFFALAVVANAGTTCWKGTTTGKGQGFSESDFEKRTHCCPITDHCVRVYNFDKGVVEKSSVKI